MSSKEEIPWNEDYALDINLVDTEHKKLFMIINKLYRLKNKDTIKEDLAFILNEFIEYMEFHFEDEEEYMLSIGYPNLEEHKILHKKIVDIFGLVIKKPASLELTKVKIKMLASRYFVSHIVNEDMKIKQYLEDDDEMIFDLTNL